MTPKNAEVRKRRFSAKFGWVAGGTWGERRCGSRPATGPRPPGSGGKLSTGEGSQADAVFPHAGKQVRFGGSPGGMGVYRVGGRRQAPERGRKPIQEGDQDGPGKTAGSSEETNRIMIRYKSLTCNVEREQTILTHKINLNKQREGVTYP